MNACGLYKNQLRTVELVRTLQATVETAVKVCACSQKSIRATDGTADSTAEQVANGLVSNLRRIFIQDFLCHFFPWPMLVVSHLTEQTAWPVKLESEMMTCHVYCSLLKRIRYLLLSSL